MFAHPAVSITRKSTRQGGVLLGERTTRLYIFRAKVFLLERLAVAFVPVGVPEALGLPGTRRGWAGDIPTSRLGRAHGGGQGYQGGTTVSTPRPCVHRRRRPAVGRVWVRENEEREPKAP
jgi:hypothetical protein